MIDYYRTTRGCDKIQACSITEETGRMVHYCGRWQRKKGVSKQYHATYEHARHFLAKRTKAEIRALEGKLDEKRKLLATLEAGR